MTQSIVTLRKLRPVAFLLLAGGAALPGRAQTVAPPAPPIVAPAPLSVAAAPSREAVAYYGVYIQNAKIGNAQIKRDDNATRDGKPAVRVDMQMTMDLTVMGAPNRIKQSSATWADKKTGAPLYMESRTETGPPTPGAAGGFASRTTITQVSYTDRALSYVNTIGGVKNTGTLTLKAGETFLVDPSDGADIKPQIGLKQRGKVFIPELSQLVDSEVEVLGRENVTVGGVAVTAYKVADRNPVAPATLFINEGGDMLRMDSIMGMQMRKEAREVALAAPGAGDAGPDLIALTGLRPNGASLGKARTARSITYQITGVTRNLAPNDTVQTVSYGGEGANRFATVTVYARPLPASKGATRFARLEDAPPALRSYLQSTAYIGANDPEFVALARKIVGSETDTARAAARIAAWVHQDVRPDPASPPLRTARDIKNEPRGVCRDYTTLFTAIARAAGIPTKSCVGVGYGDGLFVGHAWPEVWVGGNTWVALEPTWGAPFADATHIKLAEGEITDFFKVAADMGGYKIKVLKVE